MGDAMATPTDKANHTSTQRMMLVVLRRYCMSKILNVRSFKPLVCAWSGFLLHTVDFNQYSRINPSA
jgi:hypothetical protein